MSTDNIEAERALAYLLEDIATEFQLIAGELGKRPFACIEERFNNICRVVAQTKSAGYAIGIELEMDERNIVFSFIEEIKRDLGLSGSAANAATELSGAAQKNLSLIPDL